MIEKPKKERRFLKALGRVGEILIQEVLIKIGSNLIKKIGGKKTLPSILFLLVSLSLFAQYPATGNKQRLGYQTTGDGLVFRGRASDTTTIKSSGLNNAYFILDTVNNVLFNYIKTKGGWQFSNGDTIIINNNFTQPFDSLFFKTSVPTNNVDTAKMRWDSDLGTVVLGMYDKVPNELGFKNFWLVKNQTGSTITKGSIVYANGTVGASGRITVAKFIANGSIDAKYLLGITAHDLTDGEDGYVISFGKIRQVNTDTFLAGAILYPSPTTAGVWTDVEPIAPNIDMPIGFCINSSLNNGTIAIRVASGYKLSELHDVSISSPVENSSLYYKGGLWRDTTAALLTSDTASMLTNYLRTGTAASTYLPLTGGTISGASSANNYTDTLLNVNYQYFGLPVFQNVAGIVTNVNTNGENAFGILSETSTIYKTAIGVKGKANLLATGGNGVAYGILGEITATAGGGSASNSYAGYFNNTSTVSDGNHYGLFVNTASGGDYGIYQTGSGINYFGSNTSIGGTLGVTGVTTLSAPLTVNSSAVFNEGSTDSDFRVESDGNANMVFVDASTDRVGIGTNAPDKTLHVNGEVKIATVTATPTALLGKDGSNVVGEVTTVAQTGIMKAGGTTTNTSSVGIITVAHGLPYTPSQVFVTLAQQSSYVIVCHSITSSNMLFTVYDSLTGLALDNVSVGFFWLAIK